MYSRNFLLQTLSDSSFKKFITGCHLGHIILNGLIQEVRISHEKIAVDLGTVIFFAIYIFLLFIDYE